MKTSGELNFYIRQILRSELDLSVSIGGQKSDELTIKFGYVRAYIQYKESDFFDRIANYEGTTMFDGGAPSTGVFLLQAGSILKDLVPEFVKEEEPQIYWISTPDECVEIMCFEEPRFHRHGRI